MEGGSGIGRTRRFDGAGEHAAKKYWKWRKWAKAHLKLLQVKNFPPQPLGSAIFSYLDGPARMAWEGITIDLLVVSDGAERAFQFLDARFPDFEGHDKIGESPDEVFPLAQVKDLKCLRRQLEKVLRCQKWHVDI